MLTPEEALCLPAAQSPQAVLTPATALYFPAWQLSQAVLTPGASLYFPASQWSQAVLTPATALCFPASQMSQPVLTPESALYFPAWHIPQASLLRTALNVPAPHMLHAPTVVAPYPALLEQKALPGSLWELAQHDTHNAGPLAALYVPAAHAEHDPACPV